MLSPFLLVGVGGSGGKTVRAIKQALNFKLQQEGWNKGMPEGWQFLHIDSPTAADGVSFPAPMLPQSDYLSLVPFGINYKSIHDDIVGKIETSFVQDIRRSLPSPIEVKVPVDLGAGAYRAVGRTISAGALTNIRDRVKLSVSKMESPTATSELKELSSIFNAPVNEGVTPTVIVISSVAGGSGAGMFIDVAEAIKAAVGPKPWVHRIFSLLYAPDVFAGLGPERMKAMAPNALGALAELVGGFYSWGSATDVTRALYEGYGLTVPSDARYSLGPNFNYIVGRKNAKAVDFESQEGVYLAAATSVAAWMTDANVQEQLLNYALTNLSVSVATPDATGLKRENKDPQPVSSLGFARVTLGLDKFADYAAERLAKQTLETIMFQHKSSDPELKEKKEDQWIEYFANMNAGAFIFESGLDELTELNNQVVDELKPDLGELVARLQSDISHMAGHGVSKGQSFDAWVSKLSNAYEVCLPPLLSDAEVLIRAKARDWVGVAPARVMALVRKTISQQGLPVTIELLGRLIDQVTAASSELLEERGRELGYASQITSLVSENLSPAQQMPIIPASHPAVAEAYFAATTCLSWRVLAEIKLVSSQLLEDINRGYLEPLRLALSRGYGALSAATVNQKLPDGRQNPYSTWPNFKSKSVDKRFKPAPNEQMLIAPDSFPSKFDELMEQTVNDPQVQAARKVIDEVLGGSKLLQGVAELDDSLQWMVLDLLDNQMWVPKESKYRIRDQANQEAAFAFDVDHMNYVEIAKKWLRIPGRASSAFLQQSIVSFIGASGNVQEKTKRSADFVSALGAAIQSADPLVELDPQLVQRTHGAITKTAVCSGIPVDDTDPIQLAIRDTLVGNGHTNPDAWFISSAKGAKRQTIEIFTQLSTTVSPLVMSSLLGPISDSWIAASSSFDSRSNFMNWRRGRALPEAIPAHRDRWQAMLRGWHVARLLNLFENDTKNASYTDKGPKVSVWTNPTTGWSMFPYPLHSSHIARIVDDYPAVVLDSLIVALVSCYSEHSLAPLEPYQRLMELGGGNQDQWTELENWVLDGRTQTGAPEPKADRAGRSADTASDRRTACLSYVNEMAAKFRERMANIDPNVDPRTYPIAWEIRGELEASFEEVLNYIRTIEASDDL